MATRKQRRKRSNRSRPKPVKPGLKNKLSEWITPIVKLFDATPVGMALLDRNLKILFHHNGEVSFEQLRQQLELAL